MSRSSRWTRPGRALYSVAEARRKAERSLPPILWDFIEGGGGREITLADNEEAFQRVKFSPRLAAGVTNPDMRTTVAGTELASPIILAPCGGLALVHPDGQLGVAQAASEVGSVAAVSVMSGGDLTRVIEQGGGAAHWFQLYKLGGRVGADALIDFARDAGYGALVVSMDTPVGARRDRDMKHAGVRPGGFMLDRITPKAILEFAPRVATRPGWAFRFVRAGFPVGHPVLDLLPVVDGRPPSFESAVRAWRAAPAKWQDLEWMRARWPRPLIVKGILSPADARRAVDAGADGIVVSNHGGRQLDGTPATIDVLPDIVSAIPSSVDVIVDGGVRLGIDVVRALALGARAVMVGRPYIYGLAVRGRVGVKEVMDSLNYQVREAMQLLGAPDVKSLDSSFLR